jgi:hypothetical protein
MFSYKNILKNNYYINTLKTKIKNKKSIACSHKCTLEREVLAK